MPKYYTTYIIEKLLKFLCKYSEKFNKDLFLLLSMKTDENSKENQQLEVSLKLIYYADAFIEESNFESIFYNH